MSGPIQLDKDLGKLAPPHEMQVAKPIEGGLPPRPWTSLGDPLRCETSRPFVHAPATDAQGWASVGGQRENFWYTDKNLAFGFKVPGALSASLLAQLPKDGFVCVPNEVASHEIPLESASSSLRFVLAPALHVTVLGMHFGNAFKAIIEAEENEENGIKFKDKVLTLMQKHISEVRFLLPGFVIAKAPLGEGEDTGYHVYIGPDSIINRRNDKAPNQGEYSIVVKAEVKGVQEFFREFLEILTPEQHQLLQNFGLDYWTPEGLHTTLARVETIDFGIPLSTPLMAYVLNHGPVELDALKAEMT